jgi:hypothetical protein
VSGNSHVSRSRVAHNGSTRASGLGGSNRLANRFGNHGIPKGSSNAAKLGNNNKTPTGANGVGKLPRNGANLGGFNQKPAGKNGLGSLANGPGKPNNGSSNPLGNKTRTASLDGKRFNDNKMPPNGTTTTQNQPPSGKDGQNRPPRGPRGPRGSLDGGPVVVGVPVPTGVISAGSFPPTVPTATRVVAAPPPDLPPCAANQAIVNEDIAAGVKQSNPDRFWADFALLEKCLTRNN